VETRRGTAFVLISTNERTQTHKLNNHKHTPGENEQRTTNNLAPTDTAIMKEGTAEKKSAKKANNKGPSTSKMERWNARLDECKAFCKKFGHCNPLQG